MTDLLDDAVLVIAAIRTLGSVVASVKEGIVGEVLGQGAPRGRLSQRDVVAAALALIEREGAPAFSMGAVAAELGVYPRAVAWHVGTREDLLRAVVDEVFADVELHGEEGTPWPQELLRLGLSVRRSLSRRRAVLPLVQNRLTSPASRALAERVIDVLAAAGLDRRAVVVRTNAFLAYVIGFHLTEAGGVATGDEPWSEQVEAHLEAVVAAQPGLPDLDASFAEGLAMLLAGMARG
jgi:AcrR family transcriptional regulator